MNVLDGLKRHLERLVFAEVRTTIPKDENLISYWHDGKEIITCDDPNFKTHWERKNRWQRINSRPSYSFYYGFAQNDKLGDIHFDSKGHCTGSNPSTGLGINTHQCILEPPPHGTWIVGYVCTTTRTQRATATHFSNWSRCTGAEKVFAEYLVNGTPYDKYDLGKLVVEKPNGERSNRLIHTARLLLSRDLSYFLRQRHPKNREKVDHEVHEICTRFDHDLWEEYRRQCVRQEAYSTLIPCPS